MDDRISSTLTATGDLMFYGPMAERMQASNDMLWGFRQIEKVLTQGDLLFGNFETPISVKRQKEPDATGEYFSPPGMAQALKELGYDVVNLAHNHIYDFGVEGVETTIRELADAGLPFIGIGQNADEAARPAIVRSRTGITFGFLGYTTSSNTLNPKHKYVACFPHFNRMSEDIRALKEKVDVIVVSCHTGSQYNPYPAPETRQLAYAAIDSGAMVFLGHHPHVSQGWERIGKGIAIYSLGDFVTPVHTEQTRRTFFVRIKIADSEVREHQIVPCYITDDCQTVLAEGKLHKEIANHIERLSQYIADGSSDDMHFKAAKSMFFSQYVTSWIREFRCGGPRVIIRKMLNLRYYHLQLICRTLFGKFFQIKKR
jgi:poly-gamma-glutamate synthesis protein (capsule biosynthesis protein)